MLQPDIESKVSKIICELLKVKKEAVVPDAHFREDLGADSLDEIELVMAFEDEFNIEIPEEDMSRIKTVGDALKIISRKV